MRDFIGLSIFSLQIGLLTHICLFSQASLFKMLMISSTSCVCRTPTLTESTRLPSPWESSRVWVDVLPSLSSRSPRSTSTSALANSEKQILKRFPTLWWDPSVSITYSPKLTLLISIEYGIPKWFLNRQRCLKDGTYSQLIANMVDTRLREDLERMKKARQHRGLRHYLGIKVRGQKTKSTGRTGKTLGVTKKKWSTLSLLHHGIILHQIVVSLYPVAHQQNRQTSF